MTDPLTLFAIVETSEADLPCVEVAVVALARQTRAETGCVQYEMYVSTKLPRRLIIHEIWSDEAALDRHLRSESVAQFKQALGGTTAKVWVSRFQMPI